MIFMFKDNGKGVDNLSVGAGINICDFAKWQPKWTIEKYDKNMKLYETEEIGNLLLNEGIGELLKLLIGGTATAFNNANSFIGVDGTTAAINRLLEIKLMRIRLSSNRVMIYLLLHSW